MLIKEVTMAKPGSDIWWAGFAKGLIDQRAMPVEDAKNFVRRLRKFHKDSSPEQLAALPQKHNIR